MPDLPKAIWITGASSGIGKAITFEFAKNGLLIIGTARRIDLLTELKRELAEFDTYFEAFQLDVSNHVLVDNFYKIVSQNYQIDCLINNAGITSFKDVTDNSFEEIRNIIEVNLLGSIYAIKSVLPEMLDRKSGTIINILSAVTQKIYTASSAYSASKSGLQAYAQVLREEVRDKNIRVINISPGATATPIWSQGVLQKYSDRMMNTDSIAKLIYQLYSEKSNLVTEEVLVRPIKGDL